MNESNNLHDFTTYFNYVNQIIKYCGVHSQLITLKLIFVNIKSPFNIKNPQETDHHIEQVNIA